MLTENITWGTIPAGFTKIVDPGGYYAVVRHDRVEEIDASFWGGDAPMTEPAKYQGRGLLRVIRLRGGENALVRSYRHGGLFRGSTRDWFFTWPPRPFRELAITEELRRRGLRTIEVYAACVRRIGGPMYRGWLVTRELGDASDLWAALQGDFARRSGTRAVLKAAAEALRSMHHEGVYHADLNLKNILIRSESGGMAAYVIDFDKARLFFGKLPAALAHRNLKRLLRSARKLDPERLYLSPASWKEFLEFYHGRADA